MLAENAPLAAMQKQLNELQQTVTLMIEDKTAREAERRQPDEERDQLQAEIRRLAEAQPQQNIRQHRTMSDEQAQKPVLMRTNNHQAASFSRR